MIRDPTLHDFGGVLGRPLKIFFFGLSQFRGPGFWLVCEVALMPPPHLTLANNQRLP